MRFKLITLFTFFCSTSYAQNSTQTDLFDVSLEDLKNITVSSIDFSNRSLTNSFASAYVINNKMIESLPMITLGDHIEMLIPGTNVVPQGNNGAGIGMRGYSSGGGQRTLILWDGHSLNRKDSDGNMSAVYSPLLNDLEQVEVVLGPGSVKHGTGALNGYVNLVPKSGQTFQGSKIDLDYGPSDDSQRLQVQRGHKYGNNRDFYVYAGVFHADGFQLSNDFGGSISPVDNERRKFDNRNETRVGDYDPSYKVSMNWTHDRFNLKTLFEHLEFNPGGLVANKKALNQRTTFSLQPKYTFQLPNKSSFELSSALALFDKSRIQKPINFFNINRFNESGGRESAFEIRGTFQTLHFDRHEIAIGAQINWLDTTSEKHFFSTDPISHNIHVDGKWKEYSMYFEDIYHLSKKTTLIGSLRYDGADFDDEFHFENRRRGTLRFKPDDISNFSPRLALTHETDNDLIFRATYQEGFAYPSVSSYSLTFIANNFLESEGLELLDVREEEKLQNFELGLRGDLIEGELYFDLSLYYNRFKNNASFVNFRSNPSFLSEGLGAGDIPNDIFGIVTSLENDVDGYGTELSLNWKPNNTFFANFSYAYAVPDHINAQENDFTGLATSNLSEWRGFPKHQIRTDLNFKLNKWQFSIAGTYQSGIEVNDRFAPTRENAADEFVRVNFGINYKFNKQTDISFIAKNLFNNNTPRVNIDPSRPWQGSLGSDERLFYLGLRYTF